MHVGLMTLGKRKCRQVSHWLWASYCYCNAKNVGKYFDTILEEPIQAGD